MRADRSDGAISWGEFKARRPDLTDAGKALLYQFGVGLAFVATVDHHGSPRVHPICPVVTETGLVGFVISSPKLDDMLRDGRYALHSYPTDHNEDAF